MNGRLILLAAITVSLGCRGPVVETQVADTGSDNLLKLNNLIVEATKSLGRPPRSEAELRSRTDKATLDAILKSPNDGQPIVVLWGIDPAAPKGRNGPASVVIAYEAQGKNGFRWVLTSTGVDKLSAEQFKDANFPAGHQPP